MTWTTPADLKSQVQRLWDRGLLLAPFTGGAPVFPRRLRLKGPDSRALSERFAEVREWIARLSGAAGHYRMEWRRVNHRILGANEIPSEIWIDSLADALGFIGRRRDAEQFAALVEMTRSRLPEMIPWMAKRPLRALGLAHDWPQLLEIADWMKNHPRPAVYLRQIDLPGVHTKFIEGHRGVLAEWFDLILPPEAIDDAGTGIGGFCRRYGFREKPLQVRFRILDPEMKVLPVESDQDITLTQAAFSQLESPVSTVFITENEINFLAFPNLPDAMVIFGAGYGFDHLAPAAWMREKKIHYWGDIDTHGFAILDELRGAYPHAASFLMDRRTLLAHRPFWGIEARPETKHLLRLNAEESDLYDHLRRNHWGDRIRLEQERIGFDFLLDALKRWRPVNGQA